MTAHVFKTPSVGWSLSVLCFVAVVVIVSTQVTAEAMAMTGGLGQDKVADNEVQEKVDQVLGLVNQKTGKNYSELKAISYRSQVVAGTNYFVKVKADDGTYLHLRIYQPLPYTNQGPELSSLQAGKGKDDAIEFFD